MKNFAIAATANSICFLRCGIKSTVNRGAQSYGEAGFQNHADKYSGGKVMIIQGTEARGCGNQTMDEAKENINP